MIKCQSIELTNIENDASRKVINKVINFLSIVEQRSPEILNCLDRSKKTKDRIKNDIRSEIDRYASHFESLKNRYQVDIKKEYDIQLLKKEILEESLNTLRLAIKNNKYISSDTKVQLQIIFSSIDDIEYNELQNMRGQIKDILSLL